MDGERPLTKAEIDDLQRIANASTRAKKEVDYFEPQSKLKNYRPKRRRVIRKPLNPALPRQALALSAARKSAPPRPDSDQEEGSSSDASEDGDPRDMNADQLAARNQRISPGAMQALEEEAQAQAGAGAGADSEQLRRGGF